MAVTTALAVGLFVLPAMAQYTERGDTGSLTLTKSFTDSLEDMLDEDGDAAEVVFEFDVVCVDDDGDEEVNTKVFLGGYEGNNTFEADFSGSGEIHCTITEVGAAADNVDITVEPSSLEHDFATDRASVDFTLVLGDDVHADVTVDFENDGDIGIAGPEGALVVEKALHLENLDRADFDDVRFGFSIACDSYRAGTISLAAGEQYRVDDLNAGEECTVTETNTRSASGVAISVDGTSDYSIAETSATVTIPENDEAVVRALFSNSFVDDDEPDDEEPPEEDDPPVRDEDDDDDDDAAEGRLADTGFEVTWGMLLGFGLLLPGVGAVVYSRKRGSGEA